jgi:hypothetical protein
MRSSYAFREKGSDHPAIGLSISARTSECDAHRSELDTPGNDDIRRSSGRAVEPLSSSGKCAARGLEIPQRNPLRTGHRSLSNQTKRLYRSKNFGTGFY